MFTIPNSDGKSAIPVSKQTKAPKQQQFTIYEDETATEDNSTQIEDEELVNDLSISHIEDSAGIYVQLMQYYHGCWTMEFIMPLAQEIDEKIGSSFIQRCEAFEEEAFQKGAKLDSDRAWLRECLSPEEAKEGLSRVREQVLKGTSFAEELLALMTEIVRKRNEAQRQGHRFERWRVEQELASGTELIAGYIFERGTGVHREAQDETYFERLEKSWGVIFCLQYGWDMEKYREDCAAKRWAHHMHDCLLDQAYLESESLEKWVWLYGTRVFGGDITQCVLFENVLNVERNSVEWPSLVD